MATPVRASFQKHSQWVLAVALPILLIAVLLFADVIEGPKTAYVGVLSAIPLLSAVFGTPKSTILVSIITWASAFAFGHLASDGNVRAQTVRLVIIAIFGLIAVIASYVQTRRETQLADAMAQAAQAEAMRGQANSDPLTGLLNRRGVIEKIQYSPDHHSTVAIIDVDRFKLVNDRYGHLVGDEIICAVGARIASGLSRDDIVGRWGGDEFVVVLNLDFEQGARVVQRVFDQVSSAPLSTSIGEIPVQVSVGIAQWELGESLDTVLVRADKAMYSAKDAGRNRFVVASVA